MKKSTLIKRVGEDNIELLNSLFLNGIMSTARYIGFGRYSKLIDETFTVSNILTKAKIDFIEGNDAPRGGKIGNNIILTQKGKLQVKEYRNSLLAEIETNRLEKIRLANEVTAKRDLSIETITKNVMDNISIYDDLDAELSTIIDNKPLWQVKANRMVQMACNNDFSIGWKTIYNIVINRNNK